VGGDYYSRRNPQRQTKRLVAQLEGVLRAAQFGHARAELDEDRRVGYERRRY
jgi:hypothetical protein